MKVAIVYESNRGHTARMAEAVAAGVRAVSGAEAQLFKVGDDGKVPLEQLANSDAIVFGSPTYNGALGWRLKRFFESTTGPVWSKLAWRDKVAAGFTNSGADSGDKLGTLMSLALFAAQHGMVWVNLDLLPRSGENGDLNRLGGWLGAMAQSDDASVEVTPPDGDLRTAEHLGRRVSEVAGRLSVR